MNLNLVCSDFSCPCYSECCFLPTSLFPYFNEITFLFVGQGGGSEERKQRLPFVGDAGKRLHDLLNLCKETYHHFGFALSNTIRNNPENNRVPTKEEYDHCKIHLYKDIQNLREFGLSVIIPLGNNSKELLLNIKGTMKNCHGNIYKYKDYIIVPTYHPAAMIRQNPIFNENKLSEFEQCFIDDMGKVFKYLKLYPKTDKIV